MADFAPPSGPPPPQVPEGWKAIFNDQYQTWFYVNTHTKKSTWDKPTGPAPRPDDDAPPGGPPPSYSAGPGGHNVSDVKRRSFESNNPYNKPHGQESDAELARRLQAEEDGRRDRGQADSYYNASGGGASPNPPGLQGGYPGGPSPTSPGAGSNGKRGLFSKLLGKQSGGGSNSPYPQQAAPGSPYPPQPAGYQQGYPSHGPGYGPPGGGYGGYGGPPMGPGGYGGGGYGPPGGGYGYGQPQYIQQQAPPRRGGGLGAGGAAALGVGGGLLGGMLLGEAIDGGDGGGDYGGDDGGDFGGDGGGDF